MSLSSVCSRRSSSGAGVAAGAAGAAGVAFGATPDRASGTEFGAGFAAAFGPAFGPAIGSAGDGETMTGGGESCPGWASLWASAGAAPHNARATSARAMSKLRIKVMAAMF